MIQRPWSRWLSLAPILLRKDIIPKPRNLDRQALAGERRVLGAEAPLTLETMDRLAAMRR